MTHSPHPTLDDGDPPVLPIATIRTPLGTGVPVFRFGGMSVIKAEHAPTVLGIVDGDVHDRLMADIDRGGDAYLDATADGAIQPQPVQLSPLLASALCPRLVAICSPDVRGVLDELISLVCDEPRWYRRAGILIQVCTKTLDDWKGQKTELQLGIVICGTITLALENVGAREVTCLEQALFLAISHHRAWRKAGLAWLGAAGGWPAIVLSSNPDLRRIAHHVRLVHDDIPAWIEGGVDG